MAPGLYDIQVRANRAIKADIGSSRYIDRTRPPEVERTSQRSQGKIGASARSAWNYCDGQTTGRYDREGAEEML